MISLSIGNIDLKEYITKIHFEVSPYEYTISQEETGSGGSGSSVGSGNSGGSGSSGNSTNSRDYFLNYDGKKVYASYWVEDPDDPGNSSGDDSGNSGGESGGNNNDNNNNNPGNNQPVTVRTFKTVIRCTLEGLPDNIAAQLSTILRNDTFTASYTSPDLQSGEFLCTSYSAEPDEGSHEDGDPPDWNIDLVIENPEHEDEIIPASSSSSSGSPGDSGSGNAEGSEPGSGL